MFEYIFQVAGPDLAYFFAMKANEIDTIWTSRVVRSHATASGYICHLDLGY